METSGVIERHSEIFRASANTPWNYLECTWRHLESLRDIQKDADVQIIRRRNHLECIWRHLESLRDIRKYSELQRIPPGITWSAPGDIWSHSETFTNIRLSDNTPRNHLECIWRHLESL